MICLSLVLRSHAVSAHSFLATDAAALHCSNQSTLVECFVAALRQAQSNGRDIRAEYCRSIFQQHDCEESSSMFAKVAVDFGVYTLQQLIPQSHSQADEVLLEFAAPPRWDSRGTFF